MATGHYALPDEPFNEFEAYEFEEDLSEKEVASDDQSYFKKVMAGMQQLVGQGGAGTKLSREASKGESQLQASSALQQELASIAAKKTELKQQLGADVFTYYYDYMLKARSNPTINEALFRKELN